MPKQKWVELFQAIQAAEASSSADRAVGLLWEDLGGCQFRDARLGRRFQKLVLQLETRLGQSIPLACQDWT
ncbi:MAG: transposase DNA-binding-containing protein, partial [Bryobacteraceae bacterium]